MQKARDFWATDRWQAELRDGISPQALVLPAEYQAADRFKLPVQVQVVVDRYLTEFTAGAVPQLPSLTPVFVGPVATGKTFAAAVIAKVVSKHISTAWIEPAVDFGYAFQNDSFERRKALLQICSTVPFLILDEV